MDELKPLALLQPSEIPRLTKKWQEVRGATNSELGALLGHIAALDAALTRYGAHRIGCAINAFSVTDPQPRRTCDCGITADAGAKP